MADNIMDAFLLMVDETPEVREELDRRILSYEGEEANITRDVLLPFAASLGYNMTIEDVELHNGPKVMVVRFLFIWGIMNSNKLQHLIA